MRGIAFVRPEYPASECAASTDPDSIQPSLLFRKPRDFNGRGAPRSPLRLAFEARLVWCFRVHGLLLRSTRENFCLACFLFLYASQDSPRMHECSICSCHATVVRLSSLCPMLQTPGIPKVIIFTSYLFQVFDSKGCCGRSCSTRPPVLLSRQNAGRGVSFWCAAFLISRASAVTEFK